MGSTGHGVFNWAWAVQLVMGRLTGHELFNWAWAVMHCLIDHGLFNWARAVHLIIGCSTVPLASCPLTVS